MNSKNSWDNYDSGYYEGVEEGKKIGYEEGYSDAVKTYEERLNAQWAEIQTINARISYLEHILTDFDDTLPY
jgi:flagellar biosynthesis/type III secretory pathway protein FliH